MTFWGRSEKNTPILPMREIDYRALRLMLERSDGGALIKKKHLKKFDRAWKRGELYYAKEETALQSWMRCEARFCLGDYTDWTGWQYRDKWSEKIWFRNPFKVPVWDGKPTGRLYVVGEQGLGDEILFAQCIENCKALAGDVVIETQERLQSLFERSLKVKTARAIVGADLIRRAQPFEADAWVSLGDLPRLFRRQREDFRRVSYIVPNPERIPEMERYRGLVGISWRGAQGRVDWRKLKQLYPDCLSLQYDQAEEEVERPHVDLREDIEGVLALCSVLRKVVTVGTTVAHIAGASGAETEIIIADPKTGIRKNILPWQWMDYSQQKVPRKTWWYADNVKAYSNWGEYFAYAYA